MKGSAERAAALIPMGQHGGRRAKYRTPISLPKYSFKVACNCDFRIV